MIISNFPGGGRLDSQLPEKKALSECSWSDIAKVCKAGLASEYWAIGDTKNMINGDTTTTMRIIGFDHDWVEDQASYGRQKAGITFQMVHAISALSARMHSHYHNNVSWYSSNGAYHCDMRKTTLANYLNNNIPEELKNVLVPVMKEFFYKEKSEIQVISDILFLPSSNEILGIFSSGYGSEGEQYEYFAAGNSNRIFNTVGNECTWWTRSAGIGTSAAGDANVGVFHYMFNGNVGQEEADWNGYYAVPCMCI